jgi:hypothetical protein
MPACLQGVSSSSRVRDGNLPGIIGTGLVTARVYTQYCDSLCSTSSHCVSGCYSLPCIQQAGLVCEL